MHSGRMSRIEDRVAYSGYLQDLSTTHASDAESQEFVAGALGPTGANLAVLLVAEKDAERLGMGGKIIEF